MNEQDVQGKIEYYCTWCRESFDDPCTGPYCKPRPVIVKNPENDETR